MHVPILASHFCQDAWVVKDIAKAETFFTQIMGVKKFVRVDSLAQDNANKTFRRDLDNRLDALLTEHRLFKRDTDGYLTSSGLAMPADKFERMVQKIWLKNKVDNNKGERS